MAILKWGIMIADCLALLRGEKGRKVVNRLSVPSVDTRVESDNVSVYYVHTEEFRNDTAQGIIFGNSKII